MKLRLYWMFFVNSVYYTGIRKLIFLIQMQEVVRSKSLVFLLPLIHYPQSFQHIIEVYIYQYRRKLALSDCFLDDTY